MEYLPTDLPKYMKTTSREAVANSPVEAGHVLLFCEDGTSLTAKKSDGSFERVGGGSNVVAGYIRNNNGALTFCEAGKLEGGAISQITVSGAGSAEANGKYTTNSAVTWIKRVWTNASTGYHIALGGVDTSNACWIISNQNKDALYHSEFFSLVNGDSEISPWEKNWVVDNSGTSPAPTVSHTMIYPTGAGDSVTHLRITETLKPAPDYTGRAKSTKEITDVNPTINQTKYITPALAKIKDYTPVLKIGEEYFVNGIGGDFIPGGDFYKCSALVDAVEGTPGGDTLTLHMVRTTDSSDTKDYTFTVEDASKTGDARTWLSDNNMRLKKDNGVWVIQIASMSNTVYLSEGSYTNPWEVTMFMSYPDKAYKYNNTWTVSEASEATPASWSGYKATQGDDGKYSFADTATTGLSYDGGFTPQVGTIYTQDAKVKVAQLMEATVAIPQDGLVFWMPFDGSTEARLGSVAPASDSYTGNITYETHGGITYANVSNMLYKTKFGGESGITLYTLIAYIKISMGSSNGVYFSYMTPDGYSSGYNVSYNNGVLGPGSFSIELDKFHFFCHRQIALNKVSATLDGTTKEVAMGGNISPLSFLYIGGNSAMPKLTGGLFDVAIYNRILTDEEVTALYQRVIPLQA